MLGMSFISLGRDLSSLNNRRHKLVEITRLKSDDEKKAHIEFVSALKQRLIKGEYLDSTILCPSCKQRSVEVNINGVSIDYCPKCKGLWFDQGELSETLKHAESPLDLGYAHRKSKYRCPRCLKPMVEQNYKLANNLLVDYCVHGHGIYLEENEIDRVFNLKK